MNIKFIVSKAIYTKNLKNFAEWDMAVFFNLTIIMLRQSAIINSGNQLSPQSIFMCGHFSFNL